MIAAANAAFDPDVEEALLRVYGVDPHRATLRRVSVLLRRLPPGEWHKDEATAWSRETWMLADLIDAVNQTAWVTAAAFSKRAPARPKPYPRPTINTPVVVEEPTTGGTSWSAIAAAFAEGADGDGRW